MQARNPSDEELWEACRKLPSDFEPHGRRKWLGRREAPSDCTTCRWFVELFRTGPDWDVCVNPESVRAGLLTFREQGCWQFGSAEECRQRAIRPAQCDFMRGFETFLREQAADFIKEEVRRANDPPEEESPALTPRQVRRTPLFVVVRRLLRHADEDFRHPAFSEMTARARRDAKRYWESARCYWARTVGQDMSGIRLPENMRELEEKFWGRVEAAVTEALEGGVLRTANSRQRRAG